jgi:hypothetical protein
MTAVKVALMWLCFIVLGVSIPDGSARAEPWNNSIFGGVIEANCPQGWEPVMRSTGQWTCAEQASMLGLDGKEFKQDNDPTVLLFGCGKFGVFWKDTVLVQDTDEVELLRRKFIKRGRILRRH